MKNRVGNWWQNNNDNSQYEGEYVYVLAFRPEKSKPHDMRWDVIWFSELDSSKTQMFSAVDLTFVKWTAYSPTTDDLHDAVLCLFRDKKK
jgi:hypothetical protein